jgi:pyruvate dehydrogenase E2 component (dihydrolipoamide acetyltransferase)
MAVTVIMPKQGQSVESCIVTELKKKTGDGVRKGDVLFSYETDKASFEEESPADGVVLACFYGEGDEVPVLENMLVIGEPGEDISALQPKERETPVAEQEAPRQERTVEAAAPKAGSAAGFVSPRAAKSAEKHGVDASALAGSGAQGRVIEKDVLTAAQQRPKMTSLAKQMGIAPPPHGTGLAGRVRACDLTAAGEEYDDRKLSNMRKIIARAMHASLQNSAQLTHHLGADARKIMELRKKAKKMLEAQRIDCNITLNDMICFSVIKALKRFPKVNTLFLGDSVRYFHKVHLGLAVDTERGLMVPVARNADTLSLAELAGRCKELAAACRNGSVNPDILSSEAGTFTVSNLGNYGVEMFTPVINLPQSAILGVNAIVPRPRDLGNGVYAFVPFVGLSLTYDHRALDGGEATRFLKQIAEEIENFDEPLGE